MAVTLALALSGGALRAFSYSNHPFWWAAWLAPAPAVAAAVYAPARSRLFVGMAVGLVSASSSFGYYVTTGSITAAIFITLAYALAWGGTLRLAANAAERLPALIAALVLPASWAAILTGEFAMNSRQMPSTETVSSGKDACLMTVISQLVERNTMAAMRRRFGAAGEAVPSHNGCAPELVRVTGS